MKTPQVTLSIAAGQLADHMRKSGSFGAEEFIVREVAAVALNISTRAAEALLPHVEDRAREVGCHPAVVCAVLGLSDGENGEGDFEIPSFRHPGMGA